MSETPAQPSRLMTQRDFLGYMGLGMRVENLMQKAANDEQARRIEEAALRLVDVVGMGQQYKILGFSPKTTAAPNEAWEPPFPFNMSTPSSPKAPSNASP